MNLSKLRLKWKIFAFLLGFCALLLVILWLFQIVFLDDIYKNIRVVEIRRNAAVIAKNVGSGSIGETIDGISKNIDATIDVVDLSGRSISTSYFLQDRRIIEENAELISQARDSGGEAYEYTSFPMGLPGFDPAFGRYSRTQSLIYVKIVDNAADGGAAVIIRAVISPVNATVTTLRYQLYFISGIMLILAIILAMVIAKRVSRPIEEISQAATALAKMNYDVCFEGKGFYEIDVLSETLNRAAFELGRAESLRRELLANVSHDLRTPLSLIYSYAEMMHDFPGEISPEQTQIIMDETQRLTSLVNNVLDISKLESEMERLDITNFNLTQSILATTGRIQEFLKSDGFDIAFSHGDDEYVDADEIKISRAFYNLLINAVNYSGDSRRISVAQTVSDGFVRISITDNGEGITEADLPFIWDRYYKSGKSHKRAVIGSGLGLSIVKKIIELHGGRFGVTSKLGEGSTFWFEIARNANS